MENSKTKLSELQFTILDGMAADYEDVEQLYLYANPQPAKEENTNARFPCMLVQIRFPLRDVVDEISNMLRQGYIEAKYSNDEDFAPLCPVNLAALHHYWFGTTEKGAQAWKANAADEPLDRWPVTTDNCRNSQ